MTQMSDVKLKKDISMRFAIIGKVVNPDDIERVNPPAGPSAPSTSATGNPSPRPSFRVIVRDPRTNYSTSYFRGRVVGIEPEQPELPVSSPPAFDSASSMIIDPESISSFIAVQTFSQFPQHYVIDDGQENYITHHWFNKFWERSWDLFCVPAPGEGKKRRVFLLIPKIQAQNMLTEINTAITEKPCLSGMEQDEYVLHFDKILPRPFYLGKSTNLKEKEDLEKSFLSLRYVAWDKFTEGISASVLAAFRETLENAILPEKQTAVPSRKRNYEVSEEKAKRRMELQVKLSRTLELLQEWFGLRHFDAEPNGADVDADLRSVIPPIDVIMAPGWPFRSQVVFLSIDCEWMERFPQILTEVGLSILDTRDLQNLSPGDYGMNWKKKIKSHHLRVAEHVDHLNHEFCRGCPDKFEFGESAIIDDDDIGKAIDKCVDEDRKVILVGLNMKHDLELIAHTGSSGLPWSQYADDNGADCRLDVAELFRVLRDRKDNLGMVRLLNEMNETYTESLHNAGNDARLTMHILIRIALEAAGEKPGMG